MGRHSCRSPRQTLRIMPGSSGIVALQSVVRVLCRERCVGGTGFLHKSGKIITAAHIVNGGAEPLIVLPNGQQLTGMIKALDNEIDLAIINPSLPIHTSLPPLEISNANDFFIGTQVSTWGYPSGYSGLMPMLSVGYLAGADALTLSDGKTVGRWVVNAAFNSGNSGGPVLQIETGQVMGVVSSKLAPLSQSSLSILKVLEQQKSGLQYTFTLPDGTQKGFSEGQLVGQVLNELRSQIQLVIGHAVLTDHLRSFLASQSIQP